MRKNYNFNLPRGYLSYSAWNLWNTNKEEFRKRYYEGKPSINTPETIFGKKIAKRLEDGHKFEGIEYEVAEMKLEVKLVGNLKLLSYLDGFNPKFLSIVEIKTGHKNKDGKVPWDNVKVAKHRQLDFYSMMVKKSYGNVNNNCTLIWLETKFKTKETEFDGHILNSDSRELELTGYKKEFSRNIKEWERKKIEKDIIKSALEISEDYTLWQQKHGN